MSTKLSLPEINKQISKEEKECLVKEKNKALKEGKVIEK
jgi:hypothetical protein